MSCRTALLGGGRAFTHLSSCQGEPESIDPPAGRNHASAEQREAPCRSSPQDRYTHHEVVPPRRRPIRQDESFNPLNSLTLKAGLLRTGKRILSLEAEIFSRSGDVLPNNNIL